MIARIAAPIQDNEGEGPSRTGSEDAAHSTSKGYRRSETCRTVADDARFVTPRLTRPRELALRGGTENPTVRSHRGGRKEGPAHRHVQGESLSNHTSVSCQQLALLRNAEDCADVRHRFRTNKTGDFDRESFSGERKGQFQVNTTTGGLVLSI